MTANYQTGQFDIESPAVIHSGFTGVTFQPYEPGERPEIKWPSHQHQLISYIHRDTGEYLEWQQCKAGNLCVLDQSIYGQADC